MASAWGLSWGTAWGDSWKVGATAPPVQSGVEVFWPMSRPRRRKHETDAERRARAYAEMDGLVDRFGRLVTAIEGVADDPSKSAIAKVAKRAKLFRESLDVDELLASLAMAKQENSELRASVAIARTIEEHLVAAALRQAEDDDMAALLLLF